MTAIGGLFELLLVVWAALLFIYLVVYPVIKWGTVLLGLAGIALFNALLGRK